MNEDYNDDSTDKTPKWSDTESNLNSRDDVIGNKNENETKYNSIRNKVFDLISTFLPLSVHRFNRELIRFYQFCFYDISISKFSELKKDQVTENKLFGKSKELKDTKMSLPQILSKVVCIGGIFTIGLVLLICAINVTSSAPEINNNSDKVVNGRYVHRNSRKFENFESSARTSEELLNDITSYGLERSRYLYEIKEKRIYEHGIALTKSDPAHFVAVFNKQTPRAKELSRYGYATLEASSLLTKQ